jgi:hypothetical protein
MPSICPLVKYSVGSLTNGRKGQRWRDYWTAVERLPRVNFQAYRGGDGGGGRGGGRGCEHHRAERTNEHRAERTNIELNHTELRAVCAVLRAQRDSLLCAWSETSARAPPDPRIETRGRARREGAFGVAIGWLWSPLLPVPASLPAEGLSRAQGLIRAQPRQREAVRVIAVARV